MSIVGGTAAAHYCSFRALFKKQFSEIHRQNFQKSKYKIFTKCFIFMKFLKKANIKCNWRTMLRALLPLIPWEGFCGSIVCSTMPSEVMTGSCFAAKRCESVSIMALGKV